MKVVVQTAEPELVVIAANEIYDRRFGKSKAELQWPAIRWTFNVDEPNAGELRRDLHRFNMVAAWYLIRR